MKLSEFKNSLFERLTLLKACLVFTLQKELAYPASNWGNIFSVFFFLFSNLLLINVLFSNVKVIAGYSRDEILFFFLISEFAFLANWTVIRTNLMNFIQLVNKGDFDLILVKPVPSLFYVSFKEINVFALLRDGMPILSVILVINWANININIVNLILGIIIFILGLICLYVWQLLATLPVFWLGESTNILDLSGQFGPNASILVPLEGYPDILKLIFTTIIPVLLSTGVAVSTMLGKANGANLFTASLFVTAGALLLKDWAWKIALRNYTSASS